MMAPTTPPGGCATPVSPVISGFHSPIEQECLRILLRGAQPIVICPARTLDAMRIPTECRAAFAAGRVLFLSPFSHKPKRVTRDYKKTMGCRMN